MPKVIQASRMEVLIFMQMGFFVIPLEVYCDKVFSRQKKIDGNWWIKAATIFYFLQ